MNKGKKIAQCILAGALMLMANTGFTKHHITEIIKDAQPDYVKCYGIAAAGQNDGSALEQGGPARVQEDNACYAWLMVPRGLCEKIAHASVEKPAKGCKLPDGSLAQQQ